MGASAVGHIAARARLARPEVGVITNAAAAHLAEFGNLADIIEGKGEMVGALPPTGTAVLNADSPGFAAWCDRAPCAVVSWGRHLGDHRWSWQPGRIDHEAPGLLNLDGDPWPVPLPGAHNGANLVAAILAARVLGLTDAAIREGLGAFRPSPHRGHLRRLGGRRVLDDAYNANPASMLAAARTLVELPGGSATAVLGGMAELGPDSPRLHRECGAELAGLGLHRLLTVGELARDLAAGYMGAGGVAHTCRDHEEAAAILATETTAGDRLLVKGSRSLAMETVIEILETEHGWREGATS